MKIQIDVKGLLNTEDDKAWIWTADASDELYSQCCDFLESNIEIEFNYENKKEIQQENLEINLDSWISKDGKIYFRTVELD